MSEFSIRGASSIGTQQLSLDNDDRYRNTSSYGTFTYIIINLLARSGDIEPNPGPSNKYNKRNINRANKVSAINCDSCDTVTKLRRFSCTDCGEVGVPVCPYCITLNVVNNHSESNKICDYKCNVCIENNSRVNALDINVYTNHMCSLLRVLCHWK